MKIGDENISTRAFRLAEVSNVCLDHFTRSSSVSSSSLPTLPTSWNWLLEPYFSERCVDDRTLLTAQIANFLTVPLQRITIITRKFSFHQFKDAFSCVPIFLVSGAGRSGNCCPDACASRFSCDQGVSLYDVHASRPVLTALRSSARVQSQAAHLDREEPAQARMKLLK